MRLFVVAASLLVGLAGCSSSPGQPTAEASSSSSSPSLLVFEEPVRLTDTVHLRDAPHTVAAPPDAFEPLRIPVPPDNALGHQALTWVVPRPHVAELMANVSLWVDVQGTVLNSGTVDTLGCFWLVFANIVGDETSASYGYCIQELPVVPTGVRRLEFPLPTFALDGVEGDELHLELRMKGTLTQGASVDVLTAAKGFDSQATIAGLQLPVGTETLLV